MSWRSLVGVVLSVLLSLQGASSAPYCPDGWQAYNGYCYQLRGNTSRTARTWASARYNCRSSPNNKYQGRLASIHSSSEQNFVFKNVIQNFVNISNLQSVFIGLSSRTSRGGYAWSDDTPLSYTHWRPGFMTEVGKQCIAMGTGTGNWNDRNCDDATAYVCKMRMLNSTMSPTQAPPTTVNVYCPRGWDQYGSRCYWYSNFNLATFATARTACKAKSRGADLVSINSVYEQAYLLSRLRGKSNMWLGLNDMKTEGEYVWTDGSDVTFTDWGFREPNSHSDHEDCVELVTSTGNWNDRLCSGTLSYMCEMAATQNKPPPTPATQCPASWRSYNGHCYLFNATANLNYTMAEAYCQSQHAHLVHINDIYENAYIASQYPLAGGQPLRNVRTSHFWIGINDLKTEGLYVWTDGYPVEMTSWRQGEPNDYNHGEDCTEFFLLPSSHLVNGVWNDLFCNRQEGLICERRPPNAPATAAPQPTLPPTGSCSGGLKYFNQYCYKFDSLLRLSWSQAQQRCQQFGAELLSIHSMAEQNFVMQQARNAGFTRSFWIGLNDRDLERGYSWSDGTPVQFTNWNNGEPNNYFGQEDCTEAYMSRNKNNWNDQSCGQLRFFACKIRLGKTLIMPTATVPPYADHPCPTTVDNNVYSHGSYCYKIVTKTPNTWSAASKDCQLSNNGGGHLLSITSLDEEEFIINTVQNFNNTAVSKDVWIGLTDLGKEGTFHWSDGSPIDFVYWNIGEPNNQNSEDCVELRRGKFWNDFACSQSLPYICKFPRPGLSLPPQPTVSTISIWGHCPDDNWQSLGSYCYQYTKTAMTWPDAEKTCRSKGGHLASILSDGESTFITTHVVSGTNVWIGLNDRDNEHTFVWSDGSPVLIVSWWKNQPNDFDGQQNCVYINKAQGRWNDISCGHKWPFICKMQKIHYPSTSPPSLAPGHVYMASCATTYNQCVQNSNGCHRVTCPNNCLNSPGTVFGWQIYSAKSSVCRAAVQSGVITNTATGTTVINVIQLNGKSSYSSAYDHGISSMSQGHSSASFTFRMQSSGACDPGWISHDHACYLFVTNAITASQSWSQAQQTCRSNGAYLAVIASSQEQAFVQSQLPTSAGQVWIGLTELTGQNVFTWTDGTPVQFNVWATGQPNDQQHSQTCVLMNPNGGHSAGSWITSSCDTTAGYICEKLSESSFPTAFPTASGACPSGWLSLDSSCYWATAPNCNGSNCFLSWSDARTACKAKNAKADLTSINSYNELQTAQYVLPRLGWGKVWIGLNDQTTEGVYAWSDGSSVRERGLDWAPGEPNDNNGTQNCVAILQDGTISDQDCKIPFPYSCEMQLSTVPQPSKTGGDGGLSVGATVGIVVVVLLVVAAVVAVLSIYMFRKRRGRPFVSGYGNVSEQDDDDGEGLLGGDGDKGDDDDDKPLSP